MRKNLFVLMVALFWSLSSMSQTIPTSGLVAWYPFNGNAIDSSGNGRNGSVYGASLTTDRFGRSNSAYNFNGSSDYIEVSNHSSLSFTSKQFTFSFWVYFNSGSYRNQGVFCKRNGYSDFEYYFTKYNGSSGHNYESRMKLWDLGGMCDLYNEPRYGINLDSLRWYNVIITGNGSVRKIYINNVLIDSGSNNSSCTASSGSGSLRIGTGGGWGSNDWMDGKIDDFGIWNRELTSTEISSLFYDSTTNNRPIFLVGSISRTNGCMNQSKIISDNIRVSDVDSGQRLTWSLYSAPRHGSVMVDYSIINSGGIIRPSSDRIYTPSYNYVGNDTFVVRVSDGIYSSYQTIYITINPTPGMPTIYGDTILCRGSNTTLSGTPSGGIWYRNTSNLSVDSSGLVRSINIGEVGFRDYITYQTPANMFNCRSSKRHYITVSSLPVRIKIAGSSIGRIGDTIRYSTTLMNGYVVSLIGGSWSSDTNIVSVLNGLARYRGVGTTTINYSVNSCGRTYNASKVVSVVASKNEVSDIVINKELLLYPNPSNGILNIDLPVGGFNVKLLDINGRVIFNRNVIDTHNQFDLSEYAKGVYILIISNSNNEFTERIELQ